MAVQAEFVMRHRGCVSERFHGATTMAQLSGDRRTETRSDLFVLHAATASRLDEALRWCEEFVDGKADVVDRQPTSVVFRGINSPGGTVALIRDSPCSILWPIVYRDGLEHYRLLAPSRDSVRRLLGRLETLGDIHLRSIADVSAEALETNVPLSELTRTLTRNQMEIFQVALSRGYYDSPRGATVAILAGERGVSASTFAEHLRKAERALLRSVGRLVEDVDVLARGATKGRGRPPRPL